MREQDLEPGALERGLVGDELEQDAAERVEVCARVADLAVRLLGRHVVWRADQPAGRQARRVGIARLAHGDAEIDERDPIVAVAVAAPHDVRRLEIAVHDIGGVGLRECARDEADDLEGARAGKRSIDEDPIERLAVDQLHREVRPAIGELADRVDRDDAGMTHARGGAGFTREPLRHHRIGRDLVRRHLDRDGPVEPGLARAIHGAECTAADHRLDVEAIDRRADEAHRGTRGRAIERLRGGIDLGGLLEHGAALGAEPPGLVGRRRTGPASSHVPPRVAVGVRKRGHRGSTTDLRELFSGYADGRIKRPRGAWPRPAASAPARSGRERDRCGRRALRSRDRGCPASRRRRGCRAAPTRRGPRSRGR